MLEKYRLLCSHDGSDDVIVVIAGAQCARRVSLVVDEQGVVGVVAQGVVKWFDEKKGFGFINPDEGIGDVFVHFSGIAGRGYRSLEAGMRVEYEMGNSHQGPAATNVRALT